MSDETGSLIGIIDDPVRDHVEAQEETVGETPARVMSHGEAAFMAFREVMGTRTPWVRLPKQSKDAWEAAAKVGRDEMRQQYKVPMIMLSSSVEMVTRFVHDLATNVHVVSVPACPACGESHADQVAVTLPPGTPGGGSSFFVCPATGLPVTMHDRDRADALAGEA